MKKNSASESSNYSIADRSGKLHVWYVIKRISCAVHFQQQNKRSSSNWLFLCLLEESLIEIKCERDPDQRGRDSAIRGVSRQQATVVIKRGFDTRRGKGEQKEGGIGTKLPILLLQPDRCLIRMHSQSPMIRSRRFSYSDQRLRRWDIHS